jgi:hypothetical protein
MATLTDNKGKVELLPADDLVVIYDSETNSLYLYARGIYVTPALTTFARKTWFGGLKFAFEGFYTDSPDPADKPKPTEHQFVEKFHIKPIGNEVTIITKNWPDGKEVPVAYVSLIQ